MSFYRITHNEKYDFATLHNWGCTFHCPFCSYKLRGGKSGFAYPKPERFLSVEEQKETLARIKPGKVYFMGGEPTVAKEISEMIRYAKCELNAYTKLGHTNGSNLDIPFLDAANIGFKAWNDDLHLRLTGKPKSLIFDNFSRAFDSGMELSASMIFIPGLIGLDEMEQVVKYVASLNPKIYFHVMGYIPVPGLDYKRPTRQEMDEALALCKTYLSNVGSSHLTSEEALDLTARDDRFNVKTVAGA